MIPPIPIFELERLRNLENRVFLDLLPESEFEAIRSLAARIFKVPTACLSLLNTAS
ncbi:MAG: hypothetical protein JWL90_621, partial [Chthoniobacteraceae bacterium]|nr:hypothetical protein [Chthoniobacteraceae bacterium]